MKYLYAAIAAVGLFASGTAASAATSQNREAVSISVVTAGLDLGSEQDVGKLRTRVSRAIALACNPGDRLNADMSPDYQCRREMAANAAPQLNQLLRSVSAQN
jgi:UrcA family protein